MITSYQLFCEAIKLSDAKNYTKLWYDSGADKLHQKFFQDLFKGKPDTKYRLYYPFETQSNLDDNIKDSTYTRIIQLLIDNEYTDVDYIGNKTTDKYKRIVKISSVLAKLKQPELLNQYNANLNRSNTKSADEYKIVISRHPVDLAGMSTDRGWTSCMDLDDGCNKQFVKQDVIYGTLVAYIIKSTDLNIKNPIARCLIKPFTNKKTIIYLPERKTYGTLSLITQREFTSFITKWCNDNLNKDIKNGEYRKNTKLYADDGFNNINIITDLRKFLLDEYKSSIIKIDKNTIKIQGNVDLSKRNLKSLDTKGLKVIVGGYLNLRQNPELNTLESLKGLNNFEIGGFTFIDWSNFIGITLKDILIFNSKNITDNTIEIDNNLNLDNTNIKSLDTDGFKVILNGDLDIQNNSELTSIKGLENWDIMGKVSADWEMFTDTTLKQIILYKYNDTLIRIDDNTIKKIGELDLSYCALKSLDTDGLKVIVTGSLTIKNNPDLTSLKGIDNFEIQDEIYVDWNTVTDITLKNYILFRYKNYINWIDDNTIELQGINYFSLNHNFKTLNTDGLKIIFDGDLFIGDNSITSLKGIENWDIKGYISADWRLIEGVTLKDIILYKYKPDIKWINNNTIKIDSDDVNLDYLGLETLDTGGLNVIITGNLNILGNPLKSYYGLENFEVKGITYKQI